MKARFLLAMALVTLPVLASNENWGIEELETAHKASLAAFEEQGFDLATISGFSLKRTAQGNAARAEIYHTTQSGTETVKLFCHVHDTDIDCH